MNAEVATGALLIAVPLAFNAAFFELGRAFDYPNILRKEPDEILRRFAAGGPGLILRWQALLLSAVAMLPLVAMVPVVLEPPAALAVASLVVGVAAALSAVISPAFVTQLADLGTIGIAIGSVLHVAGLVAGVTGGVVMVRRYHTQSAASAGAS